MCVSTGDVNDKMDNSSLLEHKHAGVGLDTVIYYKGAAGICGGLDHGHKCDAKAGHLQSWEDLRNIYQAHRPSRNPF